jgi:hypothetical protein
MHRVTESAVGILLLVASFLLGAAGLLTDLIGQSDPPTLFGGAMVFGIAAVAITLDEHRRTPGTAGHWTEALFGRALIAVALVVEVVALALGLQESPYRNLWFVLAIIVVVDGLAVTVDTQRVVVARHGSIETRSTTDAIPGAVLAALGLGLGVVGFLSGLFDNPHAPAWLYAGVTLAVLSVAFMFDEHAYVSAVVRSGKFKSPWKATPSQK